MVSAFSLISLFSLAADKEAVRCSSFAQPQLFQSLKETEHFELVDKPGSYSAIFGVATASKEEGEAIGWSESSRLVANGRDLQIAGEGHSTTRR